MTVKAIKILSVFLLYILQIIQTKDSKIPENFSIGVATSAFQVEGGWNEDGRGLTNWDTYIDNFPEKISNNSNAHKSCDSYHKFDQDLQALIDLKVNHYRFSISWSRIMPNGDNSTFNSKGVEYYNYIINELLKHNITPMVTMFHFDLPEELSTAGGFTNPELIGYFEEYAKTLFEMFGDRVKNWITFNQPLYYCLSAYGDGSMAPGILDSGISDYLCMQNLLKAHAIAYRAYRNNFHDSQKGRVGITFSSNYYFSKDNNQDIVNRALQFGLGLLANPIYSKNGGFPELVVQEIEKNSLNGSRFPQLDNFWRDTIKGSADFLGINYYTSVYVEEESSPNGTNPSYQKDCKLKLSSNPLWKRAKSSWLYMVPEGLENLLKYIRDEYDNVEVFIFENGWSDDGDLLDYDRVEYLRNHIQAILNAIDDGCNVTGYTTWSLMDNFEWIQGYSERFGLYYIDFNSEEKERKPKLSSKFFAKMNKDRVVPSKDFKYELV